MGEGNNKDPAIKLFGKTIPLRGNNVIDDEVTSSSINSSFVDNNNNNNDNDLLGDDVDSIQMIQVDQNGKTCHAENHGISNQDSATSPSPGTTTDNDNPLSGPDKKSPAEPSKLEDQNPETTVSPEKTRKKPEKIIPCPRCNSMDTKFCYYNNYNVNQPRHFCRKCQRYWTAGGTMRNVPVGAGRRKNKNRAEIPNGAHPVLAFGSDSPLCESMVSVLSLADQTGFQKRPENLKVQIPNLEASATSASKDGALSQISLPYPPQLPCYSPWPYPWTPQVAFPIYPPPPYWGCVVSNPWISPVNQTSPSSGPNSTTLGKHSRDGNIKELNDTGCERSLWVPKTLRIDDPGEAAKSSIWTTLGLKNSDKTECINRGSGLFKAFQTKTPNLETSTMLKANPAALSRSQNFQESS